MAAQPAQIPADNESASLQARLQAVAPRPPEDEAVAPEVPGPTVADPVGLFRHLEASGRFERDSGFGRIYHPGMVSLRENVATDSLHAIIHHNRVAAHVDRVSPLRARARRLSRYSLRQAAAHNLVGMAHDLVRLARGRQGDHRSELHCEWVWSPAESVFEPVDLLDPTTSAWSVQLEARVGGTLDEARLRGALATALGRQRSTTEPFDVVDCADDACLDEARRQLQRQPVPANEWPPLRARLARHPGGDVLMLNLNHAAADGPGALQVLRSIARAYAGDASRDRVPDFLSVRDLPVRPASAPVSAARAWYRAAVERLRDQLARPARIAVDGATDDDGFGFHLVSLSPEETRVVVDGDRPGTSRNLLMAALHLTIGDWNLKHGTPGRRIGVLVPVNLRPPGWPDAPVGNFSVTARVSTSRRHRAGPTEVLEAIRNQTTRNKRTRTGIALLAGLERAGLLPLWAKQSLVVLQPLTGNRLVDTAMLANLGTLEEPPPFGTDAGPTVDVWYSVPARAPLALCIGAVTVSGRLHLTFRFPHRLFSSEAAGRFADLLLAHIRVVAENRP